MNKFEKQLEKWNNGVLRGAQAKLAKILGVSTATTALWATGKRRPSKGYAAKMATLFHLDLFEISRLFDNLPSTVYSEPISFSRSASHFLREKNINYTTRNANNTPVQEAISPEQSNSIRLPFLNEVALHYPDYKEDTVIEWWSIPRRYALGAKYIVRSMDIGLPDAETADDLCFINPDTELNTEKVVLLYNGKNKYTVRRVRVIAKQIHYFCLNGKADAVPKSFTVVGCIVRRIKSL